MIDVLVIGDGAIGGGLAVACALAGRTTACLRRSGAATELELEVAGARHHARLHPPAPARVVALTVKSQDAAAAVVQHGAWIGASETFVVVRNGLPWRRGAFAGARHTIAWSCADRLDDVIRWATPTKLAIERVDHETASLLRTEWTTVTTLSDAEMLRLVFAKLMVNTSVNPLCAVTGQTPGALVRDAQLRARVLAVAAEIAALGRHHGADDLDPTAVLVACEQMGDFPPSMLQDRRRGATLEVDALVFEPLEAIRVAGLDAPALAALGVELSGFT